MATFDLSRILSLQHSRLFTFHAPLSGRSQLLINDFSCSDELSRLYSIQLGLISQDATIQLKQLIGQHVSVELALPGGSTRYFDGYVTRFMHLGTDGGLARYSATVSPWLWMLGRRFDTRIFQDKNAEDILRDVFSQYSKLASYEFRIRRDLKPYSYCTQYRESDLNFARRLLEQEGLFFFFEHTKDGHKLVITDDSSGAKEIDGVSTLRYSTGEMLDGENVVTSWGSDRQLESGSISLKTFDYKAPGAQRYVSADTMTNQGDVERYEIYDYAGQHGFDSTDRGEELAKFRLEAMEAAEKVFIGASNCYTLAPDRIFQLTGHYDHDSDNDEDNHFLILSVNHQGSNNYQSSDAKATYSNRFVCIRKKIPFRPVLATTKPVIAGPQTAIVVGPKGEEIYTDALGRVKVQFHWDRLGKSDQASSCWVRVGQPWAGGGFGAIQIPRIGDEVVVSFLDGNPDRPLIISRVFNAQNMPPWSLPASATQSGILTRSSKGASADNANAIRFEDRRGQEEVWIHAEKDQRIEVENDESHSVGNDRDKSVANDEKGSIGRNWTLSTGGIKFETVGLASVQSVGLGKMLNVGMAYNVNVGGLYLRNVVLQMASTVGMSRTDRVVQDWTAHVGHTYTVTVRGKAVGDAVKKDQQTPLDVSPGFDPQLPAHVKSPDSNQIQITDQGKASLSGSATAQLIGPGGMITIDAAGIHLKGAGIYLEGPVTQRGGSSKSLAPVTEADCAECAKKTTSAHPVDVATGQKVLSHDDFVLPGRVPIRWSRRYRSADQRMGDLGVAWKLQYSTQIHLRRSVDGTAEKLVYFDFDGRQLQFPVLAAGQEHFHPLEKYTLVRLDDREGKAHYAVRFPSGITEIYGPHPADSGRWLLDRYETRDGQQLTFVYTSTGGLQEVRNNRYRVSCRHDDHDRIVEVHLLDEHGDSMQKLAAYQYDEHGDLVKAVDRGGQVWRYRYLNHLLARYETPAGATFVAVWDGDTPAARCVRTYAHTHDNEGKPVITRDTRFDYRPSARTTRVTDAQGHTTTYRYNGLWAVDQITRPDGSVEETEFDDTGSVAAHVDALGRRTQAVNDTQGNPIAIRDASGNLTRIQYSEQGLPTQITDPSGQIWQREYDQHGNLVKEIDPLGNATSTVFENGVPVAHTDALGNVTRTQWNDSGQLIARTDCSGFTTQYGYDAFGRQTSQTNALGQTSKYYGNAAGKPTAVEPAGLGCWKTEYDDAGRPIAHVDPLGRTTRVTWDAYGQPLGVVDPGGGKYAFEYNSAGQLVSLSNAKGERSIFAYDVRGRVDEQTGFDGRRQQYRYDAAGELIEQIDHGNDGQLRRTLIYDGTGRVIEQRLGDGTRTTFVYDGRGLLTQAYHQPHAGEASQITYEYDAAGQRTAELQHHHGRLWRLQHRLDAAGNRSETLLPGVGTLAWQRYGSGHIHGLLLNGEPLANFERDKLHRTTHAMQGPIAQIFEYSDAGTLLSHHLQDLDARGQARAEPRPWRSWQYDATGQLTGLRDTWHGERHYSYDSLSRLTGILRQSGASNRSSFTTETFQYDPVGNLLARIDGGHLSEHTIPNDESGAAGGRLTRFAAVSETTRSLSEFTYDGHGNRTGRMIRSVDIDAAVEINQASGLLGKLLSRPDKSAPRTTTPDVTATHYRYDGAHQLTAIEHADGGLTEYRYDAFGRRIAKIHTPTGQSPRTTLFVWDGDWMLQEIRADAVTQNDTAVTYVAHPDHLGPLVRLEGGKRFHYINDQLGTPQELYDDQQKIVWAADFDGYGEVRAHTADEIDNPIRFPGQYHDAESGLHYNRHRYYDPTVGRYITPDPLGIEGGANIYAYARNLPTRNIDPMGLEAMEWGAGIGTLIEPGGGTLVGGAIGGLVDLAILAAVAVGLKSDTKEKAKEKDDCPKKCPPCVTVSGQVVPVGTICNRPLDVLPPTVQQHGIYGSHYNIYEANQAPPGTPKPCMCFWKPVGAVEPANLPRGSIPCEPFAPPVV